MELSSPTVAEITKALAKAHSEMPAIKKSGTNPRFKNKYAKYDDIRSACIEVLATNGLVITQHVWPEGETQYLVTRLSHISGEWLQSKCVLPISEFTAQNFGSAMTYCKRYSLESILMLGGDDGDDDDGEEASRKPVSHSRPEKKVDIKGSDDYQKLKNSVSATGANMKHFDDYMNDLSERKGIPVIHLASEAMTRAGLIDIVIKQYSDFLAKKSKAA